MRAPSARMGDDSSRLSGMSSMSDHEENARALVEVEGLDVFPPACQESIAASTYNTTTPKQMENGVETAPHSIRSRRTVCTCARMCMHACIHEFAHNCGSFLLFVLQHELYLRDWHSLDHFFTVFAY
jgi:hypothetical protein